MGARTQGETFLLFKRSDYVRDSVVLVMGREGGLVCLLGWGWGWGWDWVGNWNETRLRGGESLAMRMGAVFFWFFGKIVWLDLY